MFEIDLGPMALLALKDLKILFALLCFEKSTGSGNHGNQSLNWAEEVERNDLSQEVHSVVLFWLLSVR